MQLSLSSRAFHLTSSDFRNPTRIYIVLYDYDGVRIDDSSLVRIIYVLVQEIIDDRARIVFWLSTRTTMEISAPIPNLLLNSTDTRGSLRC